MNFTKTEYYKKINISSGIIFSEHALTEHQIQLLYNSMGDVVLTDEQDVAWVRIYREDLGNKYLPFTLKWENYSYDNEKKIVLDICEKVAFDSRTHEEAKPHKWKEVRFDRDMLLAESDTESNAVFLDRWNAMSEQQKTDWTTYRQALRDIPQDFEDPFEVVWPTKPA